MISVGIENVFQGGNCADHTMPFLCGPKFQIIGIHQITDKQMLCYFDFTEAKLSFLFMHEFKKRISDLLLLC